MITSALLRYSVSIILAILLNGLLDRMYGLELDAHDGTPTIGGCQWLDES